jgi:hypothetical protein
MTDEELKQIARRDKSMEIDGIVPKLGYVEGNVTFAARGVVEVEG